MSMESVLTSIKKLLGIDEELEQFDTDIMTGINTSFFALNQLGIGPSEGFSITSKDDTWSEFLGERKDLEAVKTYVFLKTRLDFDPPQTGVLVDVINKKLSELEWRLNIQA